jgi:hypothetical protein
MRGAKLPGHGLGQGRAWREAEGTTGARGQGTGRGVREGSPRRGRGSLGPRRARRGRAAAGAGRARGGARRARELTWGGARRAWDRGSARLGAAERRAERLAGAGARAGCGARAGEGRARGQGKKKGRGREREKGRGGENSPPGIQTPAITSPNPRAPWGERGGRGRGSLLRGRKSNETKGLGGGGHVHGEGRGRQGRAGQTGPDWAGLGRAGPGCDTSWIETHDTHDH